MLDYKLNNANEIKSKACFHADALLFIIFNERSRLTAWLSKIIKRRGKRVRKNSQIANKTKEKRDETINNNIVLWTEAGRKCRAHVGKYPQNSQSGISGFRPQLCMDQEP